MSGTSLLLVCTAIFFIAYVTYGSWLAKKWNIDPSRETPAHSERDGVDYVPANRMVLLGHHFSSIAGAGPIIGPITAALFGWVPVVLWILVGTIFFGGVQDFGSIVASIRSKGKTIGEIISSTIGSRGKFLFSIFAWLTLIVVIAAFANIVAATFVATPAAATSSLLFILLAILFGFGVYRSSLPLGISTIVGLASLILCMYLGSLFPIQLDKNSWILFLMGYIFIASIAPVWILLQPRDYLNSFLLYAMIIFSFAGVLWYRPEMNLAAFTTFDLGKGNFLFPMLFVTVACGAISGFHSLVASGTSSKQLANEKDAKLIGYGSMVIEGLLAVIAIIAVGYIGGEKLLEMLKSEGPVNLFANGIGTFMTSFGLPFEASKGFIALTISAFAMTTLDTATRLARFIFQELFTRTNKKTGETKKSILANPYIATLITLLISGYMSIGSYITIWPIFGTANQLLAALSLLAVCVWLKRAKLKYSMAIIPMVFMFLVTLTALIQLIYYNFTTNLMVTGLSVILFILSLALAAEGYKVFTEKD
ncbi:carbon starvation protein A [Selenomonadales bacterium OttesenSCG-928-I06]|nr:carbon starvation protein A [Selenomonadales bacterium OttesenSCG-928-I06]